MQNHTYSAQGMALTMNFEGLRLAAYRDSAGILTIGYGHVGPDVHEGQTITAFEAEALLCSDLAASVGAVNRSLQIDVTQNQFDALVDFCFNVGAGHFIRSSLLLYVNQGNITAAAQQFGLWVNAGGQQLGGLVRRRAAESSMFSGIKTLPQPIYDQYFAQANQASGGTLPSPSQHFAHRSMGGGVAAT